MQPEEATHVWRNKAPVLRHSPTIPLPSVSPRCTAGAPALLLEQGHPNERSNQEFSCRGCLSRDFRRQEKNEASLPTAPPEVSGKSVASMPYLVLNDRAHLAATSEGNIPNQGAFLLSGFAPGHPPWQSTHGRLQPSGSLSGSSRETYLIHPSTPWICLCPSVPKRFPSLFSTGTSL